MKNFMKKLFFSLIVLISISCSRQKSVTQINVNDSDFFTNELNNSIIDGFFDGDSTIINNPNVYLIRKNELSDELTENK